MTVILGIDPAYSGAAGFALIDSREPTATMVVYASILTFVRKGDADERMRLLWEYVSRLIVAYDPQVVACEDTYQGVNAKTVIGLSKAVGGLRVITLSRGLDFVWVTESQQRRTAKTYPYQLAQRWVGHIPQRQQVHAIDAIAIAQEASGTAARRRREAV